jgi:8-oxo-dGTP pyrophosphatase MutT (NUDIX family)
MLTTVEDEPPIRTLGTREVYANAWLRLREDRVGYPDGSEGVYSVVEKPDFALVLPSTDDGFWLVRQYRYTIGRQAWVFPQGGWPHGVTGSPEELAASELAEETGFRARTLTHLGHLFVAYGFTSQRYHVFLAADLTAGEPHREATEVDMIASWRSRAEVDRMIASGDFADAHSLAALALFDRHRATH